MIPTIVFIGGLKPSMFPMVQAASRRGLASLVLTKYTGEVEAAPDVDGLRLEHRLEVRPLAAVGDVEEIEAAIAGLDVAGIYSPFDEAQPAVSRSRQKLGLPTTDPQQLELLLQKDVIRARLAEAGLSDLRFIAPDECARLTDLPAGGWFMKRTRGAGSIGVRNPRTNEEFESARTALEQEASAAQLPFGGIRDLIGNSPWYLEESFDGGDLLSVEALVRRGVVHLLGVTKPYQVNEPPPRRMPGGLFPYLHPCDARIRTVVQSATRVLGFTEGPIHVEVIAEAETGRVELIDFNPRVGGALIVPTISAASGVPFEDVLVDWALGAESVVAEPRRGASFRFFLHPEGERRLETLQLPAPPEVPFALRTMRRGSALSPDPHTAAWLGGLVVQCSTCAEADAASDRLLRERVRVNGLPVRHLPLREVFAHA